MKFILGRKVGMTRVFDDEGRSFAVTKIAALPCEVSQIKNNEKDGYKAVQITAYKTNGENKKIIKKAEFLEQNIKNYTIGKEINLSSFKENEYVTVEGTTKGKGFAGTIKRHGFAMGPVTHGSKNIRKPGSIGGGYPQRVVLGKKMAGHMGGKNSTIKNLRIVAVDKEYLLIAGAVPGPNKSIIKVYGKGEKAEEIVDYAAEEERIAQEKMIEADKEAKENPEKIEEIKEEAKENTESEVKEPSVTE